MTIGSLGYVGFKADDLDAWARFGTETLGMMPVDAPEGTLATPTAPHSSSTRASTVGNPRESNISLASTLAILIQNTFL